MSSAAGVKIGMVNSGKRDNTATFRHMRADVLPSSHGRLAGETGSNITSLARDVQWFASDKVYWKIGRRLTKLIILGWNLIYEYNIVMRELNTRIGFSNHIIFGINRYLIHINTNTCPHHFSCCTPWKVPQKMYVVSPFTEGFHGNFSSIVALQISVHSQALCLKNSRTESSK